MWGGPGLEGAFGQLGILTAILHNIHYAKWVMARLSAFVGSGWLKLWIGSCFPSRTPNKDEIAA